MPKHGKKGSTGHHHKRQQEHMKNNQVRKALRRGRQARLYLNENDKSFVSLNLQLNAKGLKLKQIMGDGNCLFRALADQYEQDHTKHWQYRAQVCQFILDNAPDFRPWVEDEMTLEAFIRELSKDGVFGGNETLVAFARLRNCDVVIHQLDELPWVIEATPGLASKLALHLAYHNDEDHYSSVIPIPFGEQEKPPTVKVTSHNQSKEIKSIQQSKHEIKHTKRDSDIFTDLKSNLPQPKPVQCTGANAFPEFDDLFSQVFQATGCQDNSTICQAIEDNNWEANSAIVQVLQIMSIGDDVEHGVSNNSMLGDDDILMQEGSQQKLPSNEPKAKQQKQQQQQQHHHPNPKSHPNKKQQQCAQVLSNKKRKELVKAERKSRRLEAQKKDKPENGNPGYFDDDDFNGDFQGLAI